ncbi:MAG: hypothetical protein HFACDABA_00439 [Anaerolineales bacterium]|nr:hypothetical protein [Anaerolineales bacterium]
MKQLRLYFVLFALILSACRMGNNRPANPPASPADSTPASPPSKSQAGAASLNFSQGRNDYTITVDDTPREFIIYVPSGYDPNIATPLLFMFHGSNQSGNIMYENTDWVNKAEEETILVVFPTSWEYPLLTEPGVHEKWNTFSMKDEVVEGTELKDDVKFTRTMLDLVQSTFNVDEKQIFASGFSNGAAFVSTRLTAEMNDVFAAYAISGSGIFGVDEGNSTLLSGESPPVINVSVYSIIGTQDEKVSLSTGLERPFPTQPDEIIHEPVFHQMLVNSTSLLGLSMDYSAVNDPPSTIFTFRNSTQGWQNEFIFQMVKGLFHEYPAGDNNAPGVNASDLFWDFFLNHVEQ